jgi:hypothetical protein
LKINWCQPCRMIIERLCKNLHLTFDKLIRHLMKTWLHTNFSGGWFPIGIYISIKIFQDIWVYLKLPDFFLQNHGQKWTKLNDWLISKWNGYRECINWRLLLVSSLWKFNKLSLIINLHNVELTLRKNRKLSNGLFSYYICTLLCKEIL